MVIKGRPSVWFWTSLFLLFWSYAPWYAEKYLFDIAVYFFLSDIYMIVIILLRKEIIKLYTWISSSYLGQIKMLTGYLWPLNAILNITMYSCTFLGLKIRQINIPWNIVDDFGTLTTWCHLKTSSLKCKDQTLFGFVYASILIKFN